jgi:gas vesicle protein
MAKDNGGGFFSGFLLGGILGAALALLFAPQPGSETQQMLREKGIELRDKVEEVTPPETRKAVRDAIEEGKQAATRTREDMMGRLHDKTDTA